MGLLFQRDWQIDQEPCLLGTQDLNASTLEIFLVSYYFSFYFILSDQLRELLPVGLPPATARAGPGLTPGAGNSRSQQQAAKGRAAAAASRGVHQQQVGARSWTRVSPYGTWNVAQPQGHQLPASSLV